MTSSGTTHQPTETIAGSTELAIPYALNAHSLRGPERPRLTFWDARSGALGARRERPRAVDLCGERPRPADISGVGSRLPILAGM